MLHVLVAALQPADRKTLVHELTHAGKFNNGRDGGLVVTYSLECSPPTHLDGTIVNDHSKRPIGFEFHHFHYPFDGSTTAAVAPADYCPNPNWTVGYLLEFYVRIPTKVVSDVLVSVEVEYPGQWPIDPLRNLKLY